MHQIKSGTMSPKGMDCAFLWLFCRDAKAYAKYLPLSAKTSTIPMVFALLRWDGTFGTMGGKVDPGESLREALTRESAEEANFWLAQSAEPEVLGTFQDGDWHIHSFCLELSYQELLEVRANASAAHHASPEVAGFTLAPAAAYRPNDYGDPRGVGAFARNQFCSTAKLEFDLLLSRLEASYD